jgi:hypothetical protein
VIEWMFVVLPAACIGYLVGKFGFRGALGRPDTHAMLALVLMSLRSALEIPIRSAVGTGLRGVAVMAILAAFIISIRGNRTGARAAA